jgi:hypothetical protein
MHPRDAGGLPAHIVQPPIGYFLLELYLKRFQENVAQLRVNNERGGCPKWGILK